MVTYASDACSCLLFASSHIYLHSVPVNHSLSTSYLSLIFSTFSIFWRSFKVVHSHPCFVYSDHMYQPLKTFSFNVRYQTGVLYNSLTSWLVLNLRTCPPLAGPETSVKISSPTYLILLYSSWPCIIFHICAPQMAVKTRVLW